MKLYSLLILAKNTKKSKNNFKAPKKSEIIVFPGRILPCKQNKSAKWRRRDLSIFNMLTIHCVIVEQIVMAIVNEHEKIFVFLK